ncbi:DUF262 domain-containing protein [Streptomyces sp. NPDC004579]|uniref:DUF262 domain-containing protein n=1 Tax=Streptomyces sp. NPDC004579 TaxID=3154667 RepID=UPI0033BC58B9
MEAINETWTVFTVHQRRHRIDPRPPYQRGPVWTVAKQQLLIDSLLRGYDMPKIYLRKVDRELYQHEVIDGQQRLRALWAFLDNEYAIGEASDDLPGNLVGKTYSDLDMDHKDKIGLFKVSISELRDASEIAVRELFLRLQGGESLNRAEKRNALAGPVRNFVHTLAEEHPLFPVLNGLPNKRFSWQELGAIALRLEVADGPADLKGADLSALYEDHSFDPNGSVAKNCIRTLDFMGRVARISPGKIKTRWAFVDMYLALRVLLGEYDLTGREEEIIQSHLDLESERLEAAGSLEELLAGDDAGTSDPDKVDLFNYISAFSREGATRRNVEARHRIYLKRLRAALFSENEVSVHSRPSEG